MKANKAGSIFLITILALAGIGVAYAGWTDTITVTGSANTGTVDWDVVDYSGTWVYKIKPHGIEILDVENTPADCLKEAGYIDATGAQYDWVAASWAEQGSQGDDTVQVNYVNLYPMVPFEADIVIEYTGSIPGIVNNIEVIDSWPEAGDETEIDEYTDLYLGLKRAGETVFTQKTLAEFQSGQFQLHQGDQLHVVMTITIPQNNDFMSMSGDFEYKVEIIQWSDPCDPQQYDDKVSTVVVPDVMTVTYDHYGADSYWDIILDDINYDGDYTDDDLAYSPPLENEGVIVNGWCVDEYTTIYDGRYDVNVHYKGNNGQTSREVFHDGHPSHSPTGDAWDCVDYILNHKSGMDKFDVQDAIWYFVNGGNMPSDGTGYDGYDLVQDTLANVDSWLNSGHPDTGELVAVVLDPNMGGTHCDQWIIIEVDP